MTAARVEKNSSAVEASLRYPAASKPWRDRRWHSGAFLPGQFIERLIDGGHVDDAGGSFVPQGDTASHRTGLDCRLNSVGLRPSQRRRQKVRATAATERASNMSMPPEYLPAKRSYLISAVYYRNWDGPPIQKAVVARLGASIWLAKPQTNTFACPRPPHPKDALRKEPERTKLKLDEQVLSNRSAR
jgi:hypothetical protein